MADSPTHPVLERLRAAGYTVRLRRQSLRRTGAELVYAIAYRGDESMHWAHGEGEGEALAGLWAELGEAVSDEQKRA